MDSLQNKMANATKWSSLAEVASKLITPIVNMILARILKPSAFGIVATVNIIITFAEVFQDAGFPKYLIQHNFSSKESFDKGANVAFWTNLVLSFLIWLVICIFQRPLSMLVNNTEDLGMEIAVASLSLPVYAFSSIQIAICRRNFNFQKLFWVRLITSVIPLLVTVPLALLLKNHWALIYGTLLRNIVQSIILLKDSWKPRIYYSILRLRKMFSFSVWTLAESISIWLTANMATFVVTRTLGIDAVGMFKTSINTVTGIIGIISAATVSVLFASLSRVQDNEKRYQQLFIDYQKIVGLLVIPLGTGMYMYRGLLTQILLGSQWYNCTDFVGQYALVCAIAIITNSFFSEYYRAKGKPKLSMIAQIIYLCVLIPATYFSSLRGFSSLCNTTCIMVIMFMMLHFVIMKVYFCADVFRMIKNILWIALPTGIMALCGCLLQIVSQHLLWQIFSIMLCIGVYFFAALMLKPIRNWVKESDLTAKVYLKFEKNMGDK